MTIFYSDKAYFKINSYHRYDKEVVVIVCCFYFFTLCGQVGPARSQFQNSQYEVDALLLSYIPGHQNNF